MRYNLPHPPAIVAVLRISKPTAMPYRGVYVPDLHGACRTLLIDSGLTLLGWLSVIADQLSSTTEDEEPSFTWSKCTPSAAE